MKATNNKSLNRSGGQVGFASVESLGAARLAWSFGRSTQMPPRRAVSERGPPRKRNGTRDPGDSQLADLIPAAAHELLHDANELPCAQGKSGAVVRQFDHKELGRVFLKVGAGPAAKGVRDEASRVTWASQFGWIRAPRYLSSGSNGSEAWLLMTGVPGQPHSSGGLAPSEIAVAAGRAVASLHALPIDRCPFDQRLCTRLEYVRGRIDAGLVSEVDGSTSDGITEPSVAFARLLGMVPKNEDLVVSHCDLYLHNLLFSADGVAGIIDLGWLGVSDRHIDLALLRRSLQRDFGEDLSRSLLEGYGSKERIDERRLEFYALLDQFM